VGRGKDLQIRDSSAGLARSVSPDVGAGSDLGAATFDRPGLLHDEHIPATFRTGASASSSLALAATGQQPSTELEPARQVRAPRPAAEVERIVQQTIASGVRQLAKPRRSNGRVVLRRIGWRATPDAVVITTAEQELQPRGEKRYAPSGPWQIEQRETYRNRSGKAEKRVGAVPVDDPPNAASSTGHEAPPGPGDGIQAEVANRFPEGAEALSFLPRAVRASVIGLIPTPTLFDGTVLEFSDTGSGQLSHHEVNVLRMTRSAAVVVRAKRLPGADTWDVSQAAYTFGEPEIEQV
jgi:hypothetical protein